MPQQLRTSRSNLAKIDRHLVRVTGSPRPVADPQTYGKLTLNVELAGAARLHRAASVLMDGLELSGAHI